MVMSSIGQWNNETAREIYRLAGQMADKLVKLGKISAADRNATWAKMVVENLTKANLQVPKGIAAQAGVQTARSAATGVKAAGSSAKSAAMATTANQAANGVAQATKGILRSGLPLTLLAFAAEGAHTAYQYSNGNIDQAEVKRRLAESAVTNGTGLGGAAAGAAIGSAVFPGVGTVIGSLVGGIGGALAGGQLARTLTRQ